MIKEQTIFLDITPYNINGSSLINDDTQILNIIYEDSTPQTDFFLIAKQMEWKPLVWMQEEKSRIDTLKSLRIVNLGGELRDEMKLSINSVAEGPEVIFYNLPFVSRDLLFRKECQDLKNMVKETDKIQSVFYSVGTMRLNRFVLLGWCQKNNIKNIGQPLLSESDLAVLNHEYKRLLATDNNMEYKNKQNRLYGQIDQTQFNRLQISQLSSSYINFVAFYPNYNLRDGYYDEKLWYPVLCKTIPFFVGNVNDNSNLKMHGFRPYVGFDYSADSIPNPIVRWQKLLEDNKKFFLDINESKKIYNQNKEIIEYNYFRLIQTDWKKLLYDAVKSSPIHVQKILQELGHYQEL